MDKDYSYVLKPSPIVIITFFLLSGVFFVLGCYSIYSSISFPVSELTSVQNTDGTISSGPPLIWTTLIIGFIFICLSFLQTRVLIKKLRELPVIRLTSKEILLNNTHYSISSYTKIVLILVDKQGDRGRIRNKALLLRGPDIYQKVNVNMYSERGLKKLLEQPPILHLSTDDSSELKNQRVLVDRGRKIKDEEFSDLLRLSMFKLIFIFISVLILIESYTNNLLFGGIINFLSFSRYTGTLYFIALTDLVLIGFLWLAFDPLRKRLKITTFGKHLSKTKKQEALELLLLFGSVGLVFILIFFLVSIDLL